ADLSIKRELLLTTFCSDYFALILLFRALCSTSANPNASISGGTYMAKRPLKPFLSPYQPPMGFLDERAQYSTVPSTASCFSSLLPNSIQLPCFFNIACKS